MRAICFSYWIRLVGSALLVGVFALGGARPQAAAQSPAGVGPQSGNSQGGGPPVYQRQGNDWRRDGHDRRRDDFKGQGRRVPQVSSSWFQRPYPYHLDYYKMRYGGSYAPYFGNLYGVPFGTPQVVNGNWGPEAGAWGGANTGYPIPGYEWMNGPRGGHPNGVVSEDAEATVNASKQPAPGQQNESLPAPTK
jgi:hypothetical protein